MEKIGDLKFTMEKATEQFREKLLTRESGKIKHMMKLGICREVGSIQARNEARRNAKNRAKSEDSFHSDKARGGNDNQSEVNRSVAPSRKFN